MIEVPRLAKYDSQKMNDNAEYAAVFQIQKVTYSNSSIDYKGRVTHGDFEQGDLVKLLSSNAEVDVETIQAIQQRYPDVEFYFTVKKISTNNTAIISLPRSSTVLNIDDRIVKTMNTQNDQNIFKMKIQNIYGSPSGVIVNGIVDQGKIKTGNKIMVKRKTGGTISGEVKGIKVLSKVCHVAIFGDYTELFLSGINKSDISEGDIIYNN